MSSNPEMPHIGSSHPNHHSQGMFLRVAPSENESNLRAEYMVIEQERRSGLYSVSQTTVIGRYDDLPSAHAAAIQYTHRIKPDGEKLGDHPIDEEGLVQTHVESRGTKFDIYVVPGGYTPNPPVFVVMLRYRRKGRLCFAGVHVSASSANKAIREHADSLGSRAKVYKDESGLLSVRYKGKVMGRVYKEFIADLDKGLDGLEVGSEEEDEDEEDESEG